MRVVFANMPGDISWQIETPLGGLRAPICLAQALIPLGYDVAIAANCSTRRDEIQGVPLISISDPTLSTWKKTLKSVGKIDALITLSRLDLFQYGLGIRQICWNHNPCVLLGVPEFGRPLYFVSQKIVCPSRSSANQQRAWGVPPKKIDVIPNGLDHSIFNSDHMADEVERLLRFVFIGTCSPWKGLDIALEAFLKIYKIYPSATLQIFGDAPGWPVQRYLPSKNLLLNQKNEIDWAAIQAQYPCVSYHGLSHPHHIASELKRAGFLLCPSRHEETFALAPLEAQACGCIPIAPGYGAYPERIENGVSGFTYLPNSPDMLEAIIVRALESSSRLGTIRKACISTAQNFTWEHTARSFASLIESTPHLRKSSVQCFNAASALKHALRRVRLKQ